MIRRSERPANHFTIIRNDVLRDDRLSYRARGLLAALLSRPDNWTIRSEDLAREGTEGRGAVLTALKELRDAGYLTIEKKKREDNGQFYTEQVVYDYPQQSAKDAPEYKNPTLENRTPVLYNSLEEKKRRTVKKKEHISSSSEDDGQFDRFWSVYPRKVGKGVARKAWSKALKETSAEQIISGAEQYAKERAAQDPKYTAHPSSWLAAERWTDEPDPEFRGGSRAEVSDRLFKEALARLSSDAKELEA